MKTPIADFVKEYAKSGVSRFHMPGHKGKSFLGCEKYDITEVSGADVLSNAEGIIEESEKNASLLFGTAHTYYTTEGSTAAICGMLALVKGEKSLILAARNVHKAFIHACALLDYNIEWLMSDEFSTILKCEITAKTVEEKLSSLHKKCAAVYLTSPDYLGNIQNIPEIAQVCKKYNVPLFVDNAHGAYLGFLEMSLHPIHLGAAACCDSGHKTLPVLTGGAYLHISKDAPCEFVNNARKALSLFTSTSPSYLTMQSLDLCNSYLANEFREELAECIKKLDCLKELIKKSGFSVLDSEPLKLTIDASASGYTGEELAEILRQNNAEPEFYDDKFLVLMITPQNGDRDFEILNNIFSALKPRKPKSEQSFKIGYPITKMSVREAVFAESELIAVSSSVGRICAVPTVSCPPAIPIAVSGEEITEETAALFKKYNIGKIYVVKE
ncbi:MAG: aminotransferase class I/II-fold pyridoxal phosphate-dependent enzyme [Ruminococcaceae bacterium]|nr:aminotransferase class I/II-fold pyridoxal phosphate-dependent enzyme [Oscillospiraceae bacterium]